MDKSGADISGAINGKVTVSDLLSLKASAKLNGDIVTGKLAIEPGATFTGACSMNGGVVKEINRNAQQGNAKTA